DRTPPYTDPKRPASYRIVRPSGSSNNSPPPWPTAIKMQRNPSPLECAGSAASKPTPHHALNSATRHRNGGNQRGANIMTAAVKQKIASHEARGTEAQKWLAGKRSADFTAQASTPKFQSQNHPKSFASGGSHQPNSRIPMPENMAIVTKGNRRTLRI